MADMTPQKVVMRADELFRNEERANAESQWELISEFMTPNQSGIFLGEDAKGDKKTNRLFDSTAIQAVHDLAAAFQGTVTNPATRWSNIRFKNDFLNNDLDATRWLEEVNRLIHQQFNESNLDTQLGKSYQSYVSLGNMSMMLEPKNDENGQFNGLKFTSMHQAEVVWSENLSGNVDVLYRRFKLTARKMAERFNTKDLPDEVKVDMKESPEKEHMVYHCIFPREKSKVKLDLNGLGPGKNRPYASMIVHRNSHTILEESGYYEFPAFVGRWGTMPGEVYGRGPAHIALPDVRTLNEQRRKYLVALDRMVNPPLKAIQRSILGNLDLRPGKVTTVRNIQGVEPFNFNINLQAAFGGMEEVKQGIQKIFFLDKLILPPRTETGEMTAFEVNARIEQMQRVLGPTLSRLNTEFLTPLITRTFKMLLRAGQLPQLPDSLLEAGVDVEIVYINQLAKAQQFDDIQSIQQWVQSVAMLGQIKPEAVDYINVDGIVKHVAKIQNIPEIAVTDDKQVQQIREQRQQMQAQAQMLEAANKAADTASKAGADLGDL